jgi:hypothetical protein
MNLIITETEDGSITVEEHQRWRDEFAKLQALVQTGINSLITKH